MNGRDHRYPDGHRLHQRHRNALHIAIGTRYRRQQKYISLIKHGLDLVARLEARHLYNIFQLILFDKRAQTTLPRPNPENAVVEIHPARFKLAAGFNRHMQAFLLGQTRDGDDLQRLARHFHRTAGKAR